jgi:hypothetical protein
MRALVAGMLVGLAAASPMQPCSRFGKVDPEADVRNADVIVIARATEYVHEPESETRTTGMAESVVRFEVLEVLKGSNVPAAIPLQAYLGDRDDFNDHPAPYTFVRPGGRHGSCFANTYKKGASFLLLLKAGGGEYTTDWDPLAPLNEQLQAADDPWVGWVKNQIGKEASGK